MSLVLDIETVPLAASLAAPYPKDERSHPANYKDPEKIAAWYVKDEAEWRAGRAKACALNPRLGQVVCLGWAWDKGIVPYAPTTNAQDSWEESELLTTFWRLARLAYDNAEPIVVFNAGFDLRFLLVRSWANNVEQSIPGQEIAKWSRRYSTFPVFDVQGVLSNWQLREGETLDAWAQFFGCGDLIRGSGSDVQGWYDAGDFESIAAHCKGDVAATAAIYQKIAASFSDVRQIGAAA